MVQVTSRQRIDAFWSNTLGVDELQFRTPGVQVFPNPPQRSIWRGIYVLVFDKSACVLTPPDLLETVSTAVASAGTDSVVDPETWRTMAGVTIASVLGPVLHHYRDDVAGLDEGPAVRAVELSEAADLATAVPAREWLSAGFGEEPGTVFGYFDGDRLMAASNLTPGPDAATDVGFVVHPEARGKGYGVQVVAAAARRAIELHGIARFRVLATSQSTLAIATKLGFEPYGRNLTVYLTPDSAA
jgi:GNAT superfamily N-acetyltransferase